MREEFLDGRVLVTVGDITNDDAAAIVNAANSSLLGGGGVDGAIHSKGGPKILEECRRIRATQYPDGLPTGSAVITTGGLLRAKFVIHTVGPVYGRNAGADAELLAKCYRSSISLAVERTLDSISFPSISTGVYGYPKDEAAVIVSQTLTSVVSETLIPNVIKLVFHSESDAGIFLENSRF